MFLDSNCECYWCNNDETRPANENPENFIAQNMEADIEPNTDQLAENVSDSAHLAEEEVLLQDEQLDPDLQENLNETEVADETETLLNINPDPNNNIIPLQQTSMSSVSSEIGAQITDRDTLDDQLDEGVNKNEVHNQSPIPASPGLEPSPAEINDLNTHLPISREHEEDEENSDEMLIDETFETPNVEIDDQPVNISHDYVTGDPIDDVTSDVTTAQIADADKSENQAQLHKKDQQHNRSNKIKKTSIDEAKAGFTDEIYEPFARKTSKSKNPSVITYNHAGYEPLPRSASATFVNKNQNESLYRTLSRENSQPLSNHFSRNARNSRGSEEGTKLTPRKISVTRSELSSPVMKNLEQVNFLEPNELTLDVNDYKPERYSASVFQESLNRPIKLPRTQTESNSNATLSSQFFDGSSFAKQPDPSNSQIPMKTTLPSLKTSSGANKKSRNSTNMEANFGIVLPNITSQRMPTKEALNVARGILRGEIPAQAEPEISQFAKIESQKDATTSSSSMSTTKEKDSPQKSPAKREVNTIRGPHPKWLLNNSHQKMGKAPIISECLPIEDRLMNKHKFMSRTKQFQNPLSCRMNLVPGLAEKDNSSFHEIRLKLDKIENKIGHIIRNTSHLSRSIDRPFSDSLVEAPKQILVPENPSLTYLQQQSVLMSNQRAYFQTKEPTVNRFEQKPEDKKLRVVNLVLDDSEIVTTSLSLSDTEFLPQIEDKSEKSQVQLQPVIPIRKPVFGKSFQEFGVNHGFMTSSQKLNPRNELTRSFKTTTAHVFPKPLTKEKPKITKSVSMKNVSYEKKNKSLPVLKRQNELFERISDNSSEGTRTLDETVVLRSGGEIAPW